MWCVRGGIGDEDSVDVIPEHAWSSTLDSTGGCGSQRFICVLAGGVAILDRETGLVWERDPSDTDVSWFAARDACLDAATAGRAGWRLPSTTELRSLIDAAVAGSPKLPTGHPFIGLSGEEVWTARTSDADVNVALTVSLFTGDVFEEAKSLVTAIPWCVRGGMEHDGQPPLP